MPTLTPFWRLLETRPRPEAVLGEWQRRMGDCFEIIRPLLQATGESALSYPDPNSNGRPLRVVRHRDDSIVAVCPEGDGTRLELAATDLATYAVNMTRLRSVLAEALGLAVSRTVIEAHRPTLTIGHWEPKPGATFPVVLVRANGILRTGEVLQTIAATATHSTLVLTPTREHWPSDLQAHCRRFKCVAAPLTEIIAVERSSLVAGENWLGYLETFCGYANLALPSNFTNRRPRPKRAVRAAKIEKVRNELIEHIRSARDHAHSARQRGDVPKLLPRPTKSELARRLGLKPYHLTRCFADEPQLDQLWEIAGDLDFVMKYGR